jgi:hypothetical protein
MEDRLTDLRNTLADLSAKHLATIPIKDSGYGRLDMYAVDGRVVIVRVYQLHKNYPASWDLFIPVSDSSRIDETLAALRAWAQPAAPQEGQQAKPQSKVGQYISCQTCHKPAGDQATKESGTCHDCKAQIVREGRQREANRANLRAHLAANS